MEARDMHARQEEQDSPSIGIAVEGSSAKRPERTTLSGRIVTLAPLDVNAHAEALCEDVCGPDKERLWLYLSEGPFADRASFYASLREKSVSSDPLFFAIVDNASHRPVGYAALLRIDPDHRSIEVGGILFTPRFQRTAGATEAMYLLARHIFEDLGYRRYEWKCDSLNTRSRCAALRLGFTFEGIFRQHRIVKGRNRDTAWFSMLDSEWPTRKASLERWLAPSNFDAAGQQKESLARLDA
jgi:RimJ/RimL family protein N-acetyltransferase